MVFSFAISVKHFQISSGLTSLSCCLAYLLIFLKILSNYLHFQNLHLVPFQLHLSFIFVIKSLSLIDSLASLISLNIFKWLILKSDFNLFDLYFFSMNDPIMAFPELVSVGVFISKRTGLSLNFVSLCVAVSIIPNPYWVANWNYVLYQFLQNFCTLWIVWVWVSPPCKIKAWVLFYWRQGRMLSVFKSVCSLYIPYMDLVG